MIEIKRVSKIDEKIINDLLLNLFDVSDDQDKPPTITNLEKLFADDRNYLYAAIHNGIAVGYALAYRFPSLYSNDYLAYLYDIEVLKNHRRKGVGRLLITRILTDLKSDGVKELWLGTAIDNAEGQGLFSSTGAEKSDETFNDYTYYLS